MHPSTLLILSILLLLVDAGVPHDISPHLNHRSLISRKPTLLEVYVRASEKRCPNRKTKSLKPSSSRTSSTRPASTPPAHANNGLIQVDGNSPCGRNRPTTQVTSESGPNGHIDWMNCGFEGSGWNPPYVQVKDLITVSLGDALRDPGSPFTACEHFRDLFEKHARTYGIPSILLASFAMQESSCRPDARGGGGEVGLMQITPEKCDPQRNCQDPDFNIGRGAQYFSQTLAANGGNFFLALGTYNGWKPNLTMRDAFAAAGSSCCLCQNNGDYLMQFTNGWLRNIDPRKRRLGKYFNLERCR